MPERLRALCERPVAPGVARTIVALAAATFIGFAVVVILGILESSDGAVLEPRPSPVPVAPASVERPRRPGPAEDRRTKQDPQDQLGSPAGLRASRVLQTHSALQDVPFRRGDLSIALVGARHGRAVLLVSGSTVVAARRGWRSFLHDHHDSGDAYEPQFRARDERNSGRAGRSG